MSDIIQFNKFATLHNGENIFFCKTDHLPHLFNYLRDYSVPCVLISGNSDYPITDQASSMAPACVRRWFAQNADTLNPLVTGMPMGLENHEHSVLGENHGFGWEHAIEKIALFSNLPSRSISKEIYANFSLSTHPSRREVANSCQRLANVTCDIADDHREINKKSYSDYVNNILEHKMVVCPRGNGIDCHRVWEVLYLGRVPILKKEKAMRYFESLPIIYLDEWAQMQDLEFLNAQYEKVKTHSSEMLNFSYWKDKIAESLKECQDDH